MKQKFLSRKKINEDSPFIIAEAGVNHNGSLSIAKTNPKSKNCWC